MSTRSRVGLSLLAPSFGGGHERLSKWPSSVSSDTASYGDIKPLGRIDGGRERLRTSLYAAALPAAFRWNAQLIAMYKRLIAAGKPHKLALVACARKLLIFANTVVARGTPWTSQPAH